MEKPATNLKENGFYVLIAAAGSGQRFGGEKPKQYHVVAGKTILRHTIEAFLKCDEVKAIQVIIDPAHQDMYKQAVSGVNIPAPVFGSDTRSKSVFNGLNSFSNLKEEDKILIHDAARPLIRQKDIMNLVRDLNNHKAATLAIPVVDTMRYGDQGHLGSKVDRENLWAIQTPQGFHYGALMDAYQSMDPDKEYTDETTLVSEIGVSVHIIQGHRQNFKITTQDDLDMAIPLLQSRAGNANNVSLQSVAKKDLK